MSALETVALPAFGGLDDPRPEIPLDEYRSRLVAARERMRAEGLDFLVVYGDREHFANLAWLTGFDPRFEESLLALDASGRGLLVVGNECMGYLPDERLELEVALFQEFSLMGQPRGGSRPLRETLAKFGIARGARVGCAGWRYDEGALIDGGRFAIEIPSWIADLLRDLAGGRERATNAGRIFMDPADGLRVIHSAAAIARMEHAAVRASEGVLAVVRHIRPGVSERELNGMLDSRGLPLSCHPMISFGEKARRGLSSPSDSCARLGDAFAVAFGVEGALTCRAGMAARGPEDLPRETRKFFPRFAANYFDCVAAWYESLRLGATAGDIFAAADAARDVKLFDFAVNPGHHIDLDEWVHSPFAAGCRVALRSGMTLQADIIPVSRGPFCYANAEDGVALADEPLRAEIALRHPACWRRMEARRRFMTDALGVRLDPSVLPLGNTSGWLAPYALAPERAFVAG